MIVTFWFQVRYQCKISYKKHILTENYKLANPKSTLMINTYQGHLLWPNILDHLKPLIIFCQINCFQICFFKKNNVKVIFLKSKKFDISNYSLDGQNEFGHCRWQGQRFFIPQQPGKRH